MSINQIRLYDLFRRELHLPDDKAADFVLAVGDVVDSEADNQRQLLASKDDIHHLGQKTKDDIHRLEKRLKLIFTI
ncbi:MAG TPA: hypothetical protein VFC34_12075 [Puia sp.]|nr:hypothetical protein [Puia sp.]